MSTFSRFIFFCYNLVLIFVAGVAITASTGNMELIKTAAGVFETPQGRTTVGIVALLLLIFGIAMILLILQRQKKVDSYEIETTLNGAISITDAALKVIIMRALKQVNGVKETSSQIRNSEKGLLITVHMMVNPNLSVPEMSQAIQNEIKDAVEKISGLSVEHVRVLVDDIATARKQGGV